jgi:hypothetical protein
MTNNRDKLKDKFITIGDFTYWKRNRFKDEAEYNLALSLIPEIVERKKELGAETWDALRYKGVKLCFGNNKTEENINQEWFNILKQMYGEKLYPKVKEFWDKYNYINFRQYLINNQRDLI